MSTGVSETTHKVGKLTNKFRGAKCTHCGERIGEGKVCYYWRGADAGKRTRCITCGPHPGAPMPERERRTDAELGRVGKGAGIAGVRPPDEDGFALEFSDCDDTNSNIVTTKPVDQTQGKEHKTVDPGSALRAMLQNDTTEGILGALRGLRVVITIEVGEKD